MRPYLQSHHDQFELGVIANRWRGIRIADPGRDRGGPRSNSQIKTADGLDGVGAIWLLHDLELFPGLNLSCICMQVVAAGDPASAYCGEIVHSVGGLQRIGSIALPEEPESGSDL